MSIAIAKAAKRFCVAATLGIVALAVLGSSGVHAGQPPALGLWYDKPATDWEREGLPIGNGAMGAVIMGGIAIDDIQFNEKTLWTGGPGVADDYDFGLPRNSLAGAVKQVQAMLNKTPRLAPELVAGILGHKGVDSGIIRASEMPC